MTDFDGIGFNNDWFGLLRYTNGFVQSEQTNIDIGIREDRKSTYVPVEYTPIVAGTLTGTVYRDNIAIQTFFVHETGAFQFQNLGNSSIYAISNGSSVNLTTGEITLQWNGIPGRNYLVLDYEINQEYPDRNSMNDVRFKQNIAWNLHGF